MEAARRQAVEVRVRDPAPRSVLVTGRRSKWALRVSALYPHHYGAQ